MQNLITSKTKLETSILNKLADTEQKLVTLNLAGNVKFSAMSNEQKQGLAKCLMKLSYFVGIKEPLSIENLKMLVYYLCSQHENFTQEELEQAFFMASSGSFGELEHFQTFSPSYVSKIINAYITQKSIAVTKYRQIESELEDKKIFEEKQKKYDPIEGLIEVLHTQYDTYFKNLKNNTLQDLDKLVHDEYIAKIAVQLGQTIDFFMDYNPKEESAVDFFKRIFDPITNFDPKSKQYQNPETTKAVISDWVRESAKKKNIQNQ